MKIKTSVTNDTYDSIKVGEVFYHVRWKKYFIKTMYTHNHNAVNIVNGDYANVNSNEKVIPCDAEVTLKHRG